MPGDRRRDSNRARVCRHLAGEWNRRTWYGKVLYPFWLVKWVLLMGALAGALLTCWLLTGHPDLLKPVKKRLSGIGRTASERTPKVYHDQ